MRNLREMSLPTLLFGIFPLFFVSSYSSMSDQKSWAACLLISIICLVYFPLSQTRQIGQKQLGKIDAVFLTVLLSSFALTTILSRDSFNTLTSGGGTLFHILYVILFMFITKYGSWSNLIPIISAVAVALNSILITFQLLGYNPFSLYPRGMTYQDAHELYSGEYLGTIGNVDILAVWLVVVLSLIGGSYLIISKKQGKSAWFFFAGTVLAAYCGGCAGTDGFILGAGTALYLLGFLFVASPNGLLSWMTLLTATAAAWAVGQFVRLTAVMSTSTTLCDKGGLLAVLLLLAAFFIRLRIEIPYNNNTGSNRYWRLGWLMAGLVAALGAGVFLYFVTPKGGSLWELHEILHGRIQNGFGSNRIRIWKETLQQIAANPILGYGEAFTDQVKIIFERTTSAGIRLVTAVGDPHNILLSWLFRYGLIGTTGVAGIISLVIWRAMHGGNDWQKLCALSIIAFIVIEMTCVGEHFVDPLFWALAGIAGRDELRELPHLTASVCGWHPFR